MKYSSPKIEEADSSGNLCVTIHDIDAEGYRRNATPEETQQAILYWIDDIHSRLGGPK